MELTGNYDIIIQDRAGNDLYIGPVTDPQAEEIVNLNDLEEISIFWVDGSREDNPWEYL